MDNKYIRLIALVAVIASGFAIKYFYGKHQLNTLSETVSSNLKRIDYLLANHNCNRAHINGLEIELRHYQIRKNKLQRMTDGSQDFIDVENTIKDIKTKCNLL